MIVRSDPSRPSVILIGPPGAGKSTIGRKLARELGVSLYDTDAGIEQDTGRSIPDIFATDGEPEFRRIEERVVRRAILAEHGVVSLGGGAILSAATRELLRGRTVVYLEISVSEGLRRTGASTNRPLLNGDDPSAKYRELMRVRRPLYREVASIRIRTDGRSPGRVVRAILAKLGVEPTETPAPQPDSTSTEPTGTRRSRSRGRRRRTRAAADATQPTTTSGETEAAQTDSPETDRTQPRRRARRSRRGGRRHSRNRTGTPPETAPIGPAPDRPTVTSERAPGSADAKPPAAQPNARPGRVRRTATRAAGPPGTSHNPGATAAPHPEPARPVRSGTEARPAHAADETPSPAAHLAGDAAQTAHDATAGAGRSRRARARRARTRRALEESEQHT